MAVHQLGLQIMLHKTHLPYWNALPHSLLAHSYITPHVRHWW